MNRHFHARKGWLSVFWKRQQDSHPVGNVMSIMVSALQVHASSTWQTSHTASEGKMPQQEFARERSNKRMPKQQQACSQCEGWDCSTYHGNICRKREVTGIGLTGNLYLGESIVHSRQAEQVPTRLEGGGRAVPSKILIQVYLLAWARPRNLDGIFGYTRPGSCC